MVGSGGMKDQTRVGGPDGDPGCEDEPGADRSGGKRGAAFSFRIGDDVGCDRFCRQEVVASLSFLFSLGYKYEAGHNQRFWPPDVKMQPRMTPQRMRKRPWMENHYTLIGSDGLPYESRRPGRFGGHRRTKIYGRLDCPGARYWISKGHYVKERVFFATEADAVAAGYRPCARCVRAEYEVWKSRSAGGR